MSMRSKTCSIISLIIFSNIFAVTSFANEVTFKWSGTVPPASHDFVFNDYKEFEKSKDESNFVRDYDLENKLELEKNYRKYNQEIKIIKLKNI